MNRSLFPVPGLGPARSGGLHGSSRGDGVRSPTFSTSGVPLRTVAGIWIDHRSAIIVELPAVGDKKISRIQSHADKHWRRAGRSAAGRFSPLEVPADDAREREFQGRLARYYDEIISHLGATREILILGPGEAKYEFKKRYARMKGGAGVLALESADKLTEPRLVARVRQHFRQEPSRWQAPGFSRPPSLNPG